MTQPRASSESHIVEQYERWSTTDVPFDYKRTKGGRIDAILQESGGRPRLALEVGVGPGGIARLLSQEGIHVVGMDLSPEALVRAQEHCRGHKVGLLRGSGFSLPFRDGTFPAVYASQVLHLFQDDGRLALMREVHRVLERNGRFVFDMKNRLAHASRYLGSTAGRKRRNFPPLATIRTLLQQAGFSDIDMRPGVLPVVGLTHVPNLSVLRWIAHTTFFVARRS